MFSQHIHSHGNTSGVTSCNSEDKELEFFISTKIKNPIPLVYIPQQVLQTKFFQLETNIMENFLKQTISSSVTYHPPGGMHSLKLRIFSNTLTIL